MGTYYDSFHTEHEDAHTEYTNRAATNWAGAEKLEIDTSSLWTPSNKLLCYCDVQECVRCETSVFYHNSAAFRDKCYRNSPRQIHIWWESDRLDPFHPQNTQVIGIARVYIWLKLNWSAVTSFVTDHMDNNTIESCGWPLVDRSSEQEVKTSWWKNFLRSKSIIVTSSVCFILSSKKKSINL